MIIKLILLYFGLFQIQLPCSYDIKFKELNDLAITLEMHYPNDEWISYNKYLKGFYDSITLPSLKEAFLYDRGDGINPLQPTIWWTLHGKSCRDWISWLEMHKSFNQQFGNRELAQEIHLIIKDVEWVHSIYDAVDDLARSTYPPLKRRKAIQFVKDRTGEDAFSRWIYQDLKSTYGHIGERMEVLNE